MSNGQVFEAFNLASLWALPVLFIIENNKYNINMLKTNTNIKAPFAPKLPSLLACYMILSYWDYLEEVVDLCMELNHNTR